MLYEGLPSQRYSTLVVDPPWSYNDKLGAANSGWSATEGQIKSGMYPGVRGAAAHYDTLPVDKIAELPVAGLLEPNAHVYIWTTNAFMDEAYDLAKAWGVVPKTVLTWVKTKAKIEEPEAPEDCAFGMGFYYRGTTEHVLFCVRGSLKPLVHNARNVVFAPRLAHSEKPDAFYDLVERVSPGPRVDLFARKSRPGWDVWGNEVSGD